MQTTPGQRCLGRLGELLWQEDGVPWVLDRLSGKWGTRGPGYFFACYKLVPETQSKLFASGVTIVDIIGFVPADSRIEEFADQAV